MIKRLIWWKLAALALVPFIALAVLLSIVAALLDEPPPESPCSPTASPVIPAADPFGLLGEVAGYSGVQLDNAAAIMRAGADLGVPVLGQTIGVMTAMGESTLQVLDRGDFVGPDSRGLFQQRDNGAWGTYEQRMDPYQSATSFFRALIKVPGWETLAPTIAAHRVQRNADPYHYEKHWAPATQVVAALGGGIAPAPVSAAVPCQDTAPAPVGVVAADGWTKPAIGSFTSGFGPRNGTAHNGVDVAAPLGTPIVAAAGGVVVGVCLTNSSPCTGYGTLVTIDHGGGVLTRYAHAYVEDVLVTIGQQVTAGQQVTRMGSYGQSTGSHLHFEIRQGDQFIDPVPFLRERGVELTSGGA